LKPFLILVLPIQIEPLVQPFQGDHGPFEFEVEGNGDQEVVLDLPETLLVSNAKQYHSTHLLGPQRKQ
jgi:hypothetical protein